MTKLCEMAELYKTDKAGWYTPFYSLLFEPYRELFTKVLEVGIGTKESMAHVEGYFPGASLCMWRDYFPEAQIWGVDIAGNVQVFADRICSVKSDSTDKELPSRLPSGFDLIVDDGSHEVKTQFDTFLNLFPLVKDGGFYIVEDAEGWQELSKLLEGYTHQIVLCPKGNEAGKLVLLRK